MTYAGRIKPATSLRSTPAAPEAAIRICEHCGRPLNERSSYTRHDVPFHKKCWLKSEERRELQRLMGAFDDTPENPLKGLL